MAPETKATAQDVINVLRSIDASLKLVVRHFGIGAQGASAVPSGQGTVPSVASDADLDGRHGNPEVRTKDPRDWTGVSMRGKRFSECPVEYLHIYAPFLDWMAMSSQEKADDPASSLEDAKKAREQVRYKRLEASRARGWAARIRAGYVAPTQPEGFPSDASAPLTDDDIPF